MAPAPPKAEGKLQAAAHAQTAAVEELAGRLDQRLGRGSGLDPYGGFLK